MNGLNEEDRLEYEIERENLKHYIVLYKFMPLAAFEATIDKWALKACIPYEANDPMEFAMQADNANAPVSFCSASEDPSVFLSFTRRISNMAMWGLYADAGKGVCMVFLIPVKHDREDHIYEEKSDAHFNVDDSYYEYTIGNYSFQKSQLDKSIILDVSYSDEMPKNGDQIVEEIRKVKQKYREKRIANGIPAPESDYKTIEREIYKRWLRSIVSTKSPDWKFEQENRLITQPFLADKIDGEKVLFSWPMQFLAGVVLGPNCPLSCEIVHRKLLLAHANNGKPHCVLERVPITAKKAIDKAWENMSDASKYFIVSRANMHYKDTKIEAAPWVDEIRANSLPTLIEAYDEHKADYYGSVDTAGQHFIAWTERCSKLPLTKFFGIIAES